MQKRIIPSLLVKNGGLVKGKKFKNHKYVGDPINAIRIFNEKEVDELIVLDIDATSTGKGPNFELIEKFASESFMPLCYGGGITNADQAKKLFSIGIEKICIQTSALRSISFISEMSDIYGSQAIVVSIDITKTIFGKYRLYHSAKSTTLGSPWDKHLNKCVEAGAGELIVTSVNHEGEMSGMDTSLIKEANNLVEVPVIAGGGIGNLDHIRTAFEQGISGVAVGSFFVFHGPHRGVLITYPSGDEIKLLAENYE